MHDLSASCLFPTVTRMSTFELDILFKQHVAHTHLGLPLQQHMARLLDEL